MREVFVEYVVLLKTDAVAWFRHESLIYYLGGRTERPELPPILSTTNPG